jgi:hypothetical protein
LVYGFIFNPGLAVVGSAASPNQIQDALLNYDISIVGGTASTNRISSIHLFETAAASGSGVASVSENDIGCTTPTTCSTFIVNVSTINPPGQHQDILGLNLISLHVTKDINVTSGNTVGGFATISGVRDSVDQTSSVPEPASASCVLFGGGLMVAAIALRRRRV